MSYLEYEDLFEKAQKVGKYHMFVYDMVCSRKECNSDRQSNLIHLLFDVYQEIERLQNKVGVPILHKSDDLIYPKIEEADNHGKISYRLRYPKCSQYRADLEEPFFLSGDLMGFTIKRGTLTASQVDYIFEKEKSKLGILYQFHKANGFYETDRWEEGNERYFRGYCIQQLEKISKRKIDEIER